MIGGNETAEIHLTEALEVLSEAVEASGIASTPGGSVSGDPQAPIARIRSAMSAIPNNGAAVHYNDWISLGYAVFNATGGAAEAFDLWDAWSQKSDKYHAGETEAVWKRIVAAISGTNAPRKIGAGTIIMRAKAAGWQATPAVSPDMEPPPSIEDLGYRAAVDAALNLDHVAALVAEFNRKYMVVNEGGKAIIYKSAHDPVLGRRYYLRMDFADLQKLYLNRTVRSGVDKNGKPVFSPVAQVWLRHRDRRQYIDGVTFDPSGNHDNPEVLNLWQGFAVQPRPGSWNRLKAHILAVICDGKRELCDYILNWAARMVQFPAQRGEVALVMKGVEGSGKGTFANALRRIMGQHALKIANAKHLVGNFNAHLRDCVFLFADEAFFAGDKQHVGVLKSIITEDSLTIEAKHVNAVESPNYLHLIMASNEEWVVPASLEARRFLVLLTTAAKAGNHPYFAAIHQELADGGYEAMLHDLLNRDLSGFDVRDVPHSEGLQEQKKLSLGTSELWWLDVLHRGYVYRSKLGMEAYFGGWHEVMTTEVLFASYTDFAKAKNERHPMAREAFGVFIRRMGATPAKHRKGVVGEHVADVTINQHGDTKRLSELVRQAMATGYKVGTLEAAREAFQNDTKLPVDWGSAIPDEDAVD
jgi:hypothetical protein